MKTHIDVRQADSSETTYRIMERYVEIEFPIWAERSVYVYILPMGTTEMLVAASFDDFFEGWAQYFEDYDTRVDIFNTWPTLHHLWMAGLRVELEDCALVRLTDPSEGKKKWLLATMVSDVDPYSLEVIYGPQVENVVSRVADRVLELQAELRSHKLPNPKSELAKAAAIGIVDGALAWWRSQ